MMKKAPSKHVKEIDRRVKAHGWTWNMAGKHIVWVGPEGQRVYTSATASDEKRALKNAMRDFRKEGLDLSA